MVDTGLYISFIFVSATLIVSPGPIVLLIVATSISQGRSKGLQTVAGTSVATAILLYVAAVGTAWLAATLAEVFTYVKWIGVLYLVYLGVVQLRSAFSVSDSDEKQLPSASGTFMRGFFVAITNPKTILFFGAFLPQFITDSLPVFPQAFILSCTFLILAVVLDSVYAIAAGALNAYAKHQAVRRWSEGISGSLFIGSGIGLALARRT